MKLTARLDTMQLRTEAWRAIAFRPFLRACIKLHISAHGLTTFRLVLAIAFPFLVLSRPRVAWILMGVSIILDAVDGALARFAKTDSDRGKFIDVLADQLTFSLLAIGLLRAWPHLALPLAILAFMVPALYLMVAVAHNERQPSDWLMYPKARLTGYKIIFLLAVIAGSALGWTERTIAALLWLEIAACCLHFSWHYLSFIAKKFPKT